MTYNSGYKSYYTNKLHRIKYNTMSTKAEMEGGKLRTCVGDGLIYVSRRK